MPEPVERAETNRGLMRDYFDVMSAGGDVAGFYAEDVTWTNVESGERFEGPVAVRDYVEALHTRLFDARPQGRSLDVTGARAFLEGDFVGTSSDVRVPFCLVYDLHDAKISAMRLYMSFASLPLSTAGTAREQVPEQPA